MGLDASQFLRLSTRLTGFAISCGLDPADAQDCAQETLLVLAKKYLDKDEVDAVPLAFRIVRWKIAEHRRREASRKERYSVSLDDVQIKDESHGADPEEILALKEAVHAALDRLGRKCRGVLLWQLEGLSGEEIARKMDLPTRNAAYIAINRCKKSFKQAYEAFRKPPHRGT